MGMILPKKVDGSSISVLTTPDGRVYVDIPRPKHQYIPQRSGPNHPNHYCRWDDYGLVDQNNRTLLRCRTCARVNYDEYEEGHAE